MRIAGGKTVKKGSLFIVILAIFAGVPPGSVWARGAPGNSRGNSPTVAVSRSSDQDRWQQLSPAQRQEIQRRYEEFKQLPAAEQQRIRQQYQRFQDMSPEGRQQVLERHRRLQEMPPDQREQLQREWQQIRELPSEKRIEQRKKLQQRYFNGGGGR